MSDITGKPIEYFTAVEAFKILWIALKWKAKEVARLQWYIHSRFDDVISAIQFSPDFSVLFYEIVGVENDSADHQFTVQEIKKFRKNILELIQSEITNEDEEEDNEWTSETHGSKELEKLASVIQGIYVNWTFISNIQLLSTAVSDFFKHLTGKVSDREEDGDTLVEDISILGGDIAVLKTLKSIISSYVLFLDRVPKKDLNTLLKKEQNSGTWWHMGTIVAEFKKFSTQSGMMEDISEMSFDFTSDLESTLDSWDSYLIQLQKID